MVDNRHVSFGDGPLDRRLTHILDNDVAVVVDERKMETGKSLSVVTDPLV